MGKSKKISYGSMTKAQKLRHDAYWRYRQTWGNYKSDKNKSKRTLRAEIEDILHYGLFTKDDFVKIKIIARQVGFKEFENGKKNT